MKNTVVVLIILIIFSSCYSLKTAQSDILKAQLKYPEETSLFCAEKFPVKESIVEKVKFIEGKTIVKLDTVTIDCDSVVANSEIKNKVIIKYLTKYKTDTIVKTKTILQENTAKITNLELQIASRDKTISSKNEEISSKKSLIKWLSISLITLLVVLFLLFKFR